MRLFVAVRPPEAVLDAIETIERPDDRRVRWTTRDQWHVTLRFLGEVPEPASVVDALAGADLGGRCDVRLGPEVTTLGRAVVCLPAAGLDALAAAVISATAEYGVSPEPRPFRGHLTLGRMRQGSARRFAGAPFEATFAADHVLLVHSHLRPTGAVHETVQAWPLGGATS